MEQNEHKEQYWAGKQEKEEKQSEEPIERQGEMQDDHQKEQEQFKEPIETQGEVLDEHEELGQDEEHEQVGRGEVRLVAARWLHKRAFPEDWRRALETLV